MKDYISSMLCTSYYAVLSNFNELVYALFYEASR